MDRAHRLVGFMLILVVVLFVLVLKSWMDISSLNRELVATRTRLPVYVVPGSQSGVYAPTQDELLVQAFVDLITQSFNTFTYITLPDQVDEVRKFFTPEMLTYSNDYFAQLIEAAKRDRRSSLFIPDRQSLTIENVTEGRQEFRDITINGTFQQILAGSVVEEVPLQISMRLRKVSVSRTNPFGFLVASYHTKQLGGRSS